MQLRWNHESDIQLTGMNSLQRMFCNKEREEQQCTMPVHYIQNAPSRPVHWSFHNGTLQRPSHSSRRCTCLVRPMLQQSYPFTNLTGSPRQVAHWYSTVLPHTSNPKLPSYPNHPNLHNYSPSKMNAPVHRPSPQEGCLARVAVEVL